MNAVEKGVHLVQKFMHSGRIQLGGKEIIANFQEITLSQFIEIGDEAAKHHYKQEEAIAWFCYGWQGFGKQYYGLLRSEALSDEEGHSGDEFKSGQRMPAQIIQFRSRKS